MDTEVEGLNPEVEKEARNMGWVPQDKFLGDPDKWVPADEFVARGEHFMPLLRATNARLKKDLLQRDEKIGMLQEQVANSQKTLEKLEQHFTQANKHAAEQAIVSLKESLKKAREDGDVDAEIQILEQIGISQAALKEATIEKVEPKKEVKPDPDAPFDPEVVAWQKENEWFTVDKVKTKQFNRIAEDLNDELVESGQRDSFTPRKFLEECEKLWEEKFGDIPNPNKVEGGRRGSASPGTITGWNSLPKEAREACLADADALVGEKKRFKTLDEWQRYYVNLYNKS